MPYSISLWFDQNTERLIRNIWTNLANYEISTKFAEGNFRPHITLLIVNELNVNACVASLQSYVSSKPEFSLSFESLGVFSSSTSALFLAPRPTFRLLQTQYDISTILSKHGSKATSTYYKIGQWTPHCSLAVDLTPKELSTALNLCLNQRVSIEGVVNRVGIIKNPEEMELHELFFARIDSNQL